MTLYNPLFMPSPVAFTAPLMLPTIIKLPPLTRLQGSHSIAQSTSLAQAIKRYVPCDSSRSGPLTISEHPSIVLRSSPHSTSDSVDFDERLNDGPGAVCGDEQPRVAPKSGPCNSKVTAAIKRDEASF